MLTETNFSCCATVKITNKAYNMKFIKHFKYFSQIEKILNKNKNEKKKTFFNM